MEKLLNINLLETVIKRYEEEKMINKILSIKNKPAAGPGENFGSQVERVTIKCILKSGEIIEKSVIIKFLPTNNKLLMKWSLKYGVFKREVDMLSEVVPLMRRLLKEVNDVEEPFWPEMIFHTPENEVILEDLNEYGYKILKSDKGLDFEHSAITLKTLGKMHALSVILKERNYLDLKISKNYRFFKDTDLIYKFMIPCIEIQSQIILRDWGKEWQEIGERLQSFANNLPRIIEDLNDQNKSLLSVLNHGDIWKANVMYKYIEDTETPISCRIIDYQFVTYNTFAVDLHEFLKSINKTLWRSRLEDLLKIYYNSLMGNLRKHNYGGLYFTFDDLLTEFNRLYPLSCMISLTVSSLTSNFNLEEFIMAEENDDNNILDECYFKDKSYINNLPFILKYFREKNAF